jgi:hypothetical protein
MLLAVIEFAKRINIQDNRVASKIKDYLLPFLTNDFSNFKMSKFITKLGDLDKQITNKLGTVHKPIEVLKNTADHEKAAEECRAKFKKATENNVCFCENSECLVKRIAEAQEKSVKVSAIYFPVKHRKQKRGKGAGKGAKNHEHNVEEATEETSDEVQTFTNSYTTDSEVDYLTTLVATPTNTAFQMINEIWTPDMDDDKPVKRSAEYFKWEAWAAELLSEFFDPWFHPAWCNKQATIDESIEEDSEETSDDESDEEDLEETTDAKSDDADWEDTSDEEYVEEDMEVPVENPLWDKPTTKEDPEAIKTNTVILPDDVNHSDADMKELDNMLVELAMMLPLRLMSDLWQVVDFQGFTVGKQSFIMMLGKLTEKEVIKKRT